MSKFLDLTGLTQYDGLIKAKMESERAMPLIARSKAEMEALLIPGNVNKQVKYLGLEKETVTTTLSMPKPTAPPQEGDSPARLYINPYYYDADKMHGDKSPSFSINIQGNIGGESDIRAYLDTSHISFRGYAIDKIYADNAEGQQIYHYDDQQEQWVLEEKIFAPGWNTQSRFLKGSIANEDLYVDLNEFGFDNFNFVYVDNSDNIFNTTNEWLISETKEIESPYQYGKIYEIQAEAKEMTVKEVVSPADEGFEVIKRGDQVSKLYFNTLEEVDPSMSGMPLPEFYKGELTTGMHKFVVNQGIKTGDKVYFDTTKASELIAATSTIAQELGEDSAQIVDGGQYFAIAFMIRNGQTAVAILDGGVSIPIYATAAGEYEGLVFQEGWQNLVDGEYTLVGDFSTAINNIIEVAASPWNESIIKNNAQIAINREVRLTNYYDAEDEGGERKRVLCIEDEDRRLLLWHPALGYAGVVDLQTDNFDNFPQTIT